MPISPEDFVQQHLGDTLQHEYDPAKAREYYLRTRELKGRQPGIGPEPTSNRGPAAIRPTVVRKPVAKRPSTAAKQRAATKARIASLKVKLEKLRGLLKKLQDEANKRSGVDPKANDKKSGAATGSKSNNKLTAAQRRDAAKRSKENYEKNKEKKTTLTSEEKALQEKVKDVEQKIIKAKKDLKDKVEAARRKSTAAKPNS